MTRLYDLTRPYDRLSDKDPGKNTRWSLRLTEVPLASQETRYTGMVYDLSLNSMCATYIDFPGHIKETSDGFDAANYPVERLWQQETRVVHLNRQSGSGAVTGDELAAAAGGTPQVPCVLLNALGETDAWGIEMRSVWLDFSALDWIIATGCHLFISDIYESQRLHGVFQVLFQHHISTVCDPVGLAPLPARIATTVLFPPVPGMTQIPCRLVATDL